MAGRIENLLKKIKEMSNGELGVTLSVGEQEPEVYRRWFEAGAHRYLLRVESTNPDLYSKIHPEIQNIVSAAGSNVLKACRRLVTRQEPES